MDLNEGPRPDYSSTEFESVACALCGNTETEPIAKQGRYGFPAFVSICPDCGLVYLNPRWTKSQYDGFYAVGDDKTNRLSLEQRQRCYDSLNVPNHATAAVMWERISPHSVSGIGSILDIGCGMGWQLDYLGRKAGATFLAGIESSEYCVANVVDNLGAELISNDVASDWHIGNEGRFDLITMRHALEHFLDPVAVLKKVSVALSPRGLVYVSVPNMMSPTRHALSKSWFRVVHTYYFSRATLGRALAMVGLGPFGEICSEGSELWGVFRKGSIRVDDTSVYAAQMKTIRSHRRRQLIRKPRALVPERLISLVPRGIKDRVKGLL